MRVKHVGSACPSASTRDYLSSPEKKTRKLENPNPPKTQLPHTLPPPGLQPMLHTGSSIGVEGIQDPLARVINVLKDLLKEGGNVVGDMVSTLVAHLENVEENQGTILESQTRIEKPLTELLIVNKNRSEKGDPEKTHKQGKA